MTLRVERDRPGADGETLSRILVESWAPPCLDYAAEYVRWQLSAPGAIAVVAHDGDEPIGCLAVLPRRVRLGSHEQDVGVLTFVAVRPAWTRRGVGATLYREGFAAAFERFGAIVAYTEPGSGGEGLLLASTAAAGLRRSSLGTFRAVGTLAQPLPADAAPPPLRVERMEFPDAGNLDRLETDDETLWARPTAAEWSHLLADPRGAEAVRVIGPSGEVAAAARITTAGVRNAQGDGHVLLIECLTPSQVGPEALRSLVHAARSRVPPGSRPMLVSVPSPGRLPAETLAAASLRRLPSAFEGHLILRDDAHPFRRARTTNLEIV